MLRHERDDAELGAHCFERAVLLAEQIEADAPFLCPTQIGVAEIAKYF